VVIAFEGGSFQIRPSSHPQAAEPGSVRTILEKIISEHNRMRLGFRNIQTELLR